MHQELMDCPEDTASTISAHSAKKIRWARGGLQLNRTPFVMRLVLIFSSIRAMWKETPIANGADCLFAV